MPNHFHLMIQIKEIELPIVSDKIVNKTRTLKNSIAIMLRSYTRAINKQNKLSGVLFRPHSKAECLNCQKGITPSFINLSSSTTIKLNGVEDYPQVCFDYIHNNPVKAGLVKKASEWDYSSPIDYSGIRRGKLINKEAASNLGLIYRENY